MTTLKRGEWLAPPTRCNECGSARVVYTNNERIYGRSIGEWPYVWTCMDCHACVSCHKGTKFPMGTLASQTTRKARSAAHKWFDKLHAQLRIMDRTFAYRWLAQEMGLTRAECHIGRFTVEQCEQVVRLSKARIKKGKRQFAKITHMKGRPVANAGQRRKLK